MGSIDGISVINGQNTISRWACVHGVDEPISVDLYAGAPAAKGQLIGRYPATIGSEIALAQTCRATGSAHRFWVSLTKDVLSAYGGEPVYIYGVSSIGLSNNVLANGGHFRIPAPVTFKP